MQLVRLAIVVLTTVAVTGRYLQEVHRLSVIKKLPGGKARAYYEATRARSERLLLGLTTALVVMAGVAAVYSFGLAR